MFNFSDPKSIISLVKLSLFNIFLFRMDLGKVGWGDVDWIGLAQDRNRWYRYSCEFVI
jgi:hypothetical protein